MAIEAYAIVELEHSGLSWQNPVAFCHIKLVDGTGKKPRWVVVKVLTELRYLKTQPFRYTDPHGFLNKVAPGRVVFPPHFRINDRRITITQIRHLFPECITMPLTIALDYVRDRI